MIRRALYRWIHALPADEETYLSLIVTGDQDGGQTSSVVLGWTKVTTENRDGLVGRIPRRPILSAGDSLVSAIQLAHQVRLPYYLPFVLYHFLQDPPPHHHHHHFSASFSFFTF